MIPYSDILYFVFSILTFGHLFLLLFLVWGVSKVKGFIEIDIINKNEELLVKDKDLFDKGNLGVRNTLMSMYFMLFLMVLILLSNILLV